MRFATITLACGVALAATAAQAQDPGMSFFVTSTNPGSGGNLGGLAGADAHCAALAEAAGITGKTWRAYLPIAAAGIPLSAYQALARWCRMGTCTGCSWSKWAASTSAKRW